MLAEVVLGQTDMALFLLITSGRAQNKAFLSGFYELYIRGSYRRGTNRQSSTSAITEAQAHSGELTWIKAIKEEEEVSCGVPCLFTQPKRKKKTDTDFRYYKSAQLIFVLIPLCLIENRVQKRGCLFITAAATAVCTPTSPIQPPAFIVAGNCAAGGKSRPAKLTILTSNERAGILITNFLQMAIGLRWFPSIFPMAAGRPCATLDKDLLRLPLFIRQHWHGNRRAMPPGGSAVLLRDSIKRRRRFLSGLFYPDLSF